MCSSDLSLRLLLNDFLLLLPLLQFLLLKLPLNDFFLLLRLNGLVLRESVGGEEMVGMNIGKEQRLDLGEGKSRRKLCNMMMIHLWFQYRWAGMIQSKDSSFAVLYHRFY